LTYSENGSDEMQRIRIVAVTILLAMIAVGSVAAQSTGRTRAALERAGYSVVAERSEGGLPTWDLRDSDGRLFAVSILGAFTPERARALQSLREVIYDLDGLRIERLRYVFERDRVDAVVVPARFDISGTDYTRYMPSGMLFLFEDAVAYDFRLLVDNLAVRINGQFLSKEQFLDRIVRAVANPAAYIQSQDPQFLARSIAEERSRIDLTIAENMRQNQAAEARDARIESWVERGEDAFRNGARALDMVDDRLSRETDALFQNQRELMADLDALTGTVATLSEELDALREEKANLESEVRALRRGSVILATQNLFGSLKVVDAEAIVRVVELRAADPGLSQADVLEQVNAELPEGTETLHKKHVQAIYALYFNQYE
jgi:hypothetical protein